MKSRYGNIIFNGLLALTLGCGATMGTKTDSRRNIQNLKAKAIHGGNVDEKRTALKGLCSLVHEKTVVGSENKDLTNFIYTTFDKYSGEKGSIGTIEGYPVGKTIYNGKLVSFGNIPSRTNIIRAPWKKVKEVFENDKKVVIEACYKMGKNHVTTKTSKEFHQHKARISQQQYEALVEEKKVTKGKTWKQVLSHKGVEALDGGYSIHFGLR